VTPVSESERDAARPTAYVAWGLTQSPGADPNQYEVFKAGWDALFRHLTEPKVTGSYRFSLTGTEGCVAGSAGRSPDRTLRPGWAPFTPVWEDPAAEHQIRVTRAGGGPVPVLIAVTCNCLPDGIIMARESWGSVAEQQAAYRAYHEREGNRYDGT